MNWDQLKTILWLRWRLTRNQMTRGKGIGGVVAAIIVVAACSDWRRQLRRGAARRHLCPGLGQTDRLVERLVRRGAGVLVCLDHWPAAGTPALRNHRSPAPDASARRAGPDLRHQLPRLSFCAQHRHFFARHDRLDPWPDHFARPRHAAAGAAGLGSDLHRHGLDLLPARLAGFADEQPAPAPQRDDGHRHVVHLAGPNPQPLLQRLSSHRPPASRRDPGTNAKAGWTRTKPTARTN